MFRLHIQLLRCFTMMSSIFFRPTAGRTAKQDFKFRCLDLTQLEVKKKNTGDREKQLEDGIWSSVGFSSVFAALVFLLVSTPVELTPETTLNCFFLQFSWMGKSDSLC